jgi:hypothetical protein
MHQRPQNTTSTPSHSSPSVRTITGGAVGGVLGLALIAGILFMCWRRQRRTDEIHSAPTSTALSDHPSQAANNPDLLQTYAFPQRRERLPIQEGRREEISRQLEDRQQQLASLQGTTPSNVRSRLPPWLKQLWAPCTGNMTQRSSLRWKFCREVVRLPEMMKVMSNDSEAPPK